ncbi:MAG: hypothetical protein KAR64_02435 [Thermoplasmatales archaeon]|nr:hypothetical protein [Thermoplasmatales archaeon]
MIVSKKSPAMMVTISQLQQSFLGYPWLYYPVIISVTMHYYVAMFLFWNMERTQWYQLRSITFD